MSDVYPKSVTPPLALGPEPGIPRTGTGTTGAVSPRLTIRRVDHQAAYSKADSPPRPGLVLFGLVLLLAGVALAMLPQKTWTDFVHSIVAGPVLTGGMASGDGVGAPSAAAPDAVAPGAAAPVSPIVEFIARDATRWVASGLVIIAALSMLRARALAVIVTAAMFLATVYCCDELLNWKWSRAFDGWLTEGSAKYVAVFLASVFGYLVHSRGESAGLSFRGLAALLIVVAASVGIVGGWYDFSGVAPRIGPSVARLANEWGDECTWAAVLVLTAIGVASSRTKPVHFLIAVMLGALAWHCIESGLVEFKSFPRLETIDGSVPVVEDRSLRNVELWRWVVAAELVLLSLVLLHLSLGMGALNTAFGLAWMFVGLSVYQSVGSLSLVRTVRDGVAASATISGAGSAAGQSAPLFNWGLPLGAGAAASRPSPAGGASESRTAFSAAGETNAKTAAASNPELEAARQQAIRSVQRLATVREVAPFAWMFLTAILAGLISVTGVSMMTGSAAVRLGVLCGLWLLLGIGATTLFLTWSQTTETWIGWLANLRYSRHHTAAVWLAFIASAAVMGFWALRRDADLGAWVHASAAAMLLGTCLSLGATAILIYFGGFPNLPTWVYVAVAAGQSSLMWVLLLEQNFTARRVRS